VVGGRERPRLLKAEAEAPAHIDGRRKMPDVARAEAAWLSSSARRLGNSWRNEDDDLQPSRCH
jgi:hypothetical protein